MKYHILNGDALQQRFPSTIQGEQIVFRECFVSGPRGRTTDPNFWNQRLNYLQQLAPETTPTLFENKVVQEIDKISRITPADTVYCWFEEDLFCQVNFWTCIDLLSPQEACEVFWVRPLPGYAYGYAGMNNQQCLKALEKAVPVDDSNQKLLAQLAVAYDQKDLAKMAQLAEQIPAILEPVRIAVQLEISRHQNGGGPQQIMRGILTSQVHPSFGSAFQAFMQQAPEYGFGDLQVKRIFEDVLSENGTE